MSRFQGLVTEGRPFGRVILTGHDSGLVTIPQVTVREVTIPQVTIRLVCFVPAMLRYSHHERIQLHEQYQ
jgi:hypothetical protein